MQCRKEEKFLSEKDRLIFEKEGSSDGRSERKKNERAKKNAERYIRDGRPKRWEKIPPKRTPAIGTAVLIADIFERNPARSSEEVILAEIELTAGQKRARPRP